MLRRFGRAFALSAVLAAPATWACGNSMRQHNPTYAPNARPVAKKSPTQAPLRSGEELLKDANHKFLAGDWPGAMTVAGQAIEVTEPGSLNQTRAQRIAGQSALKAKDFPRAVRYLKPLAEGPKATAYYKARLGEAQVGAGDFVGALPGLEALAKDDLIPDAEAWVALAKARNAAGDKAGARAAVKSALERDANHGEALALKSELEPAKPKAPPAAAVKTADRS